MSQLSSASRTAKLLLAAAAAAAAAVSTAAPAGPACQNDIDVLKTTCYKYVEKGTPTVPPLPDRCAAVEGVDVPCVCNYLGTPSAKNNIKSGEGVLSASSALSPSPGTAEVSSFGLVTNLCTMNWQ